MKKNIKKVIELVKQGVQVKQACRSFNMGTGYFYHNLTLEQRNELKSIRIKPKPHIDYEVIQKLFMAGSTVSSIAKMYQRTIGQINQIINVQLHVDRWKPQPLWVDSPITHYRNELINYMASTEGQSMPEYKLLEMAIELKRVNDYLAV